MTPTPAPPFSGPVICAPTIEQLDAMQLARYVGPLVAGSVHGAHVWSMWNRK